MLKVVKFNMRFIYLSRIILLCCLFIINLSASSTTITRDYTYKASENDSKLSARKAALKQLQILAIEEIGVEVTSSFSQTTQLSNEDINRQIIDEFSTFSAALTKTKILEDKWNGDTYYIKAEITINPGIPAFPSGRSDNLFLTEEINEKRINTDGHRRIVINGYFALSGRQVITG